MQIRIYISARLFPKLYKTLMEDMLCPRCGAHHAKITAVCEDLTIKPRIRIDCCKCDYEGPLNKTLHDALASWEKPRGFFASRIDLIKKKWGEA